MCNLVGGTWRHSGSFLRTSFTLRRSHSQFTPSSLLLASSSLRQQIKPDGVQRGLVGNIISRFESKGYKLVAMKTKQATKELLEEHYKDLVKKVRRVLLGWIDFFGQ